jgi:hypothetical protein
MPNRPFPCPGRCNQPWRDAEDALASHAIPHALQPHWGRPIWCVGCTYGFAEAVVDFPRVVAEIHNQALHGTPRPSLTTHHSRPAVHAWPGQSSRLLTDEIRDALTSLEDDVRELRGLRPRVVQRREGVTITAAARFLMRQVGWIVEFHPIADDPEDAPPAYLMRLHARAIKFVGDGQAPVVRKPTPCAGCGALALFQQGGSEYIECGVCGRLLTEGEYQERTREEARIQEQLLACGDLTQLAS